MTLSDLPCIRSSDGEILAVGGIKVDEKGRDGEKL